MPELTCNNVQRNRLDHLLPQGYLDGFTNPSVDGELWVLDVGKERWFPTGTSAVAAIKGFYDYAPGSEPDEQADDAFRDLESRFPRLIRELEATRFSGWKQHLDFLLSFGQMLRARSELFRAENETNTRQSKMYRVEKVDGNKITATPYTPEGEEFSKLLRNKAITEMRSEIKKGAGWFSELDWCIRVAENPADPVITTETPIIVQGQTTNLADAVKDGGSVILFPLCWRACLFGSRAKFHIEADVFTRHDSAALRTIYLQMASRFIYSPSKLNLR